MEQNRNVTKLMRGRVGGVHQSTAQPRSCTEEGWRWRWRETRPAQKSPEVSSARRAAALCVTPWSLTTGTLAKSVWIPNAALNASACAPVFAVAAFAAVVAVWHVACAVASAPQALESWLQMKSVITPIASAEPGFGQGVSYSLGVKRRGKEGGEEETYRGCSS